MTKLPPPIEKLRDEWAEEKIVDIATGISCDSRLFRQCLRAALKCGFDSGYASRDKEVSEAKKEITHLQESLQRVFDTVKSGKGWQLRLSVYLIDVLAKFQHKQETNK